jgi:bifunctional UDP-N-acetylglucosamine pyrophosphorylase/glucosamine-1-phosphate N-acetyltransferase/UDP-N-acetylglucosamine pyrophosphorylase
VKVCREALESHRGPVLIVTGDSPMVQVDSLKQLLAEFNRRKFSCLLGTLHHPNPTGLGRILRDPVRGEFSGIKEEKDASPDQRAITEVNMSTYVFDCEDLLWSLQQIQNNNQQREYYLTDCPAALKMAGKTVDALPILKACESLSINTVEELRRVEDEMRKMGYVPTK